MKKLIPVCLCCILSGCASLPAINDAGEIGFQTLHAVDVAQTIHGAAQDPCFYEGDTVTRRLIGGKPSTAGVLAWGAGYGIGHGLVTYALRQAGWEGAAAVWEAVTIASTAQTIGHNISVGIRLGAPNKDVPGCHGAVESREVVRR